MRPLPAPIRLHPLLVAVLGMVGCGPAPSTPGRGVLVIVVDALRHDHLSGSGYDRDTTPALDRFSRECVTFDDAWSASPRMTSAHVALLTGCDPLLSRRPPGLLPEGFSAPHWIPATVPSLAVEFVSRGWSTALFCGHPQIGTRCGFDRGFQRVFDWDPRAARRMDSGLEGSWGKLAGWLEEREPGEDWFAYLHVNDLERLWRQAGQGSASFETRPELDFVPPCGRAEPIFHAVPPSRWTSDRTLGDYESLYDAGLTSLDESLARVFDMVRELDSWERTTIVIAGSYGIGFGESGLLVASGTLSDVDLHVPLMIRPAPELGVAPGRRIDTAVGLVDVAPTILELAEMPPPAGMHGESLSPLLRGLAAPRREFVFATGGVYSGFAVVSDTHVYEYARPAGRVPSSLLAASWFGTSRASRTTTVEVLKDRDSDKAPGHLGRGVGDRALADQMREAANEWYRGVRKTQRVVHLLELDPARLDPEEIDALRAEGFRSPEE